ncbi:MAG: redoxin domain-containing protein [Alphaproteobacteria bacterium]|nr:redoxin domain-containing protein [Alphaproteobacteria bacterium]
MNRLLASVSVAAVLAFAGAAMAEVKVGAPAPDFKATDSNGKTVALSEFKGRTVVMEWTNNGCPYVKKHYGAGNMQALQKKYTGEGVVWLTVASSPQGEQGYVTAAEANSDTKTRGAAPTAVLLDSKSNIARLYEARNTPLMVVVDAKGQVAYLGAIDDKPTANPADIPGAKNYVAQALDEIKAGKPVSVASTKAYGCYVKYAPQS